MIPSLMCEGSPNSALCIIGHSPNKDELNEGRPFVGAPGILLWSMAKRAGFTRADVYSLLTIAEWPSSPKEEPTPEQWDRYWDFFDAALSQFTGSCILLLGNPSMQRVLGMRGILGWRGYLIPPPAWGPVHRTRYNVGAYKTNTKLHKRGDPKLTKSEHTVISPIPPTVRFVIPTLDPQSVINNGFKTVPILAYDVDRAWRVTQNALTRLDFSFSSYPMRLLDDKDSIAVDIETAWSPGEGAGIITRVGMANSAGAWSAPWSIVTKEVVEKELIGMYDRIIIGHNLCFDIPKLEESGVRINGRFFDTMLAAQALQPDLFKGLNSVSSLYLDVERWKHLADSEPEKYNAYDVIATYYLASIFTKALKERGLYDHFTSHIMPSLRILMDMQKEGLKVDLKARLEWMSRIRITMDELNTEFVKLYPDISISSPAQVARLLYDKLGLKAPIRRSADEETLSRLTRKYPHIPAPRLVLEWREHNEYLKRFLKLVPDVHGVVHPSYAPDTKDDEFIDYQGNRIQFAKGIAGTGRIQAKEPNPQQFPKKARSIFIPHTTDSVFCEFDYDSAELRVAAALSNDIKLLNAIDAGDIHSRHANDWGCTRAEAKTLAYATMYGASPNKLVIVYSKAGVETTTARCKDLQAKFFAHYPQFAAWRQQLIDTLMIDKCLRNPFGRVRYFWNPKRDTPAALDFLPQSTVADIVWDRLPTVSHIVKSYGGGLRTVVHDSFLFQVPADPEKLTRATSELKAALEIEYPNIRSGFFLPTKHKTGPSWGELT